MTASEDVLPDDVEAFEAAYFSAINDAPQEFFISAHNIPWWKTFNEDALVELVEAAFTNSFDLRRAVSNVDQAEATLQSAKSGLLPGLFANVSLQAADTVAGTQTNITNQIGASSVWQIDIFGQTRNTVRQADAALISSQELQRDVQRVVAASTAQTYFTLRNTMARLDLAKENLERLDANADRVESLVKSRYSTLLDLRRAQNQVFDQQATISTLEIQKSASLQSLALLTGRTPRDILLLLEHTRPLPVIPDQLPRPNLDSVLKHRPDIRSAQWALASAIYGKKSAKAALYPSVSLDSSLFFAGADRGAWPEFGQLSYSVTQSIAIQLIGRGRLLAEVNKQEANVETALLRYEETVLSAILDIDHGLTSWRQSLIQVDSRKYALESAVEAQQLAERLFYAGEVEFTSVILAEQTRLQAEQNYLIAQQQAQSAYVSYVSSVAPMW